MVSLDDIVEDKAWRRQESSRETAQGGYGGTKSPDDKHDDSKYTRNEKGETSSRRPEQNTEEDHSGNATFFRRVEQANRLPEETNLNHIVLINVPSSDIYLNEIRNDIITQNNWVLTRWKWNH